MRFDLAHTVGEYQVERAARASELPFLEHISELRPHRDFTPPRPALGIAHVTVAVCALPDGNDAALEVDRCPSQPTKLGHAHAGEDRSQN